MPPFQGIDKGLKQLAKLAPSGYFVGLHIRFTSPLMTFQTYPQGHIHAMYPNTEGFRRTTRNLLKLAAQCELASKAKP